MLCETPPLVEGDQIGLAYQLDAPDVRDPGMRQHGIHDHRADAPASNLGRYDHIKDDGQIRSVGQRSSETDEPCGPSVNDGHHNI